MPDFEVVVIGAGAAGVAAARVLADNQVSVRVIEARARIGGRAWTKQLEGMPFDLGCGWLHSAEENEWSEVAPRLGLTVDRTPPPWNKLAHEAGYSQADQAEFGAAWDRLSQRLDEAALSPVDRAASEFLEPGCRWNGLLNALCSFINGVELDLLSVHDLGRYRDTGVNWRVAEGYGTLVEALAAGLDVTLDCPAGVIDHRAKRLRIETAKGDIHADAVIITVPTNLIASEALRFTPSLVEKVEAADALPLGIADKVFLAVDAAANLPESTRLVGALDRTETASYHLRPFGRPVIEGYFGGRFARALEKDGGFARFAIDQIAAQLGNDIRKHLRPLAMTEWGRDPFARGSYSAARLGKADSRAILAAPVDGRLFFAGEACSRHDFSTAHGAYRTGVEAARAVIASWAAR
jgi:monoamine oxidase